MKEMPFAVFSTWPEAIAAFDQRLHCAWRMRIIDGDQRRDLIMSSALRNVAPVLSSSRRATNVTLPEALLTEARDMKINVSQACERGLATTIAEQRRQRWLAENRDAMDDWNRHVAEHGLPLAAYRQF